MEEKPVEDIDELRREFCEECAHGRPICDEPCPEALEAVAEMEES